MDNIISDDVIQVLDYHKNLFHYHNILVFPRIEGSEIKPLITFNSDVDSAYPQSIQLENLNNCHDTLKKSDIIKDTPILNFFDQFKLDVLFPIREEITCFGFLGISNQGVIPNSIELSINKMVTSFLANILKNQQILTSALSSSQKIDANLNNMEYLSESDSKLEICNDYQTVIQNIVIKTLAMMNAQVVALMLISENKKELEFKAGFSSDNDRIKPFNKPINYTIAKWVAEHGEPILIEDVSFDNHVDFEIETISNSKTNSLLCVPMNYKNKFIGVIQVLNRKDQIPFNEKDKQLLSNFSAHAADTIKNIDFLHSKTKKDETDTAIIPLSDRQNLVNPENVKEINGLCINCTYHPFKDIVSNVYGVFRLNKNKTIFVLADIIDKSIQGISLLSTLVNKVKNLISKTEDIQLIANKLNRILLEKSTNSNFLSFFMSQYNNIDQTFSYINSGHKPPFWLQRGCSSKILPPCGPLIGMIPFNYQIQTIEVKKDDLIVLYTNGITDVFDEWNKKFSGEKLRLIVDLHNEFDGKVLHDTIQQYINIHSTNVTNQQDYGFLVMQVDKQSYQLMND